MNSKEEKANNETATELQSHLELRLGISFNNNNNNNNNNNMLSASDQGSKGGAKANGSARFVTTLEGLPVFNHGQPVPMNGLGPACGLSEPCPWFPEPPGVCSGFIHPWSLAARQQKAIIEQAHQKLKPSSPSSSTVHPRVAPTPPPPVVGWPPVRAFRRNLGGHSQPPKPSMEGEKDTKRAKTASEERMETRPHFRPSMFVKVNMEGFAVGRKINLKAYDSYESLSRALQRMFNNFLSINYSNNSKQEEEDEVPTSKYVLLYEDHEGDRMLVGDVPWEMFICSVKRLYIAHSPRSPSSDDGKSADDQT